MDNKNNKSNEELIAEISLLQHRINTLEESFVNYRKQMEIELYNSKEEAKFAYRSNSVLLSNMGHDIRVPMNGVLGMIDLLNQTELTAEQKEYVHVISNSADNLMTIMDDILDFSKIQIGTVELENKTINLRKSIQEIVSLLEMKTKGKGIYLQYSVSESVPEYFNVDPVRLKQILINLINNAIKYTKEGGIKINVELIEENNNSVKLKFSIIDTGIGIPENNKEKIKNAFQINEIQTHFSEGGIGLGLAISKKLIELFKGEIGFDSIYGKGSSFWFYISLEKSDSINPEAIQEYSSKRPNLFRQLNILLVEDNHLNQKFATAALQKAGHIVDIAENGKIALDKYHKNKYDVILMDIQMPIMDGIEATLKIREWEKSNNINPPDHIKIVAITAYAMEKDRERCLASGMDQFLSKPFRHNELIKIIEDLTL
jgi:signal transduction histidine kinase/ActR/RegA family two-component response regulator